MQTGVLSTNAGSGNNLKVDQHLRLGPTDRSVFRKVSEGALFCPMLKMIKAHSNEWAFLV